MSQFDRNDIGGTVPSQRKTWVAPAMIVSETRSAESANGSLPSDFTTTSGAGGGGIITVSS